MHPNLTKGKVRRTDNNCQVRFHQFGGFLIFGKNSINSLWKAKATPCNAPQTIKRKLAPCHKPPNNIVVIKLKLVNKAFLDSFAKNIVDKNTSTLPIPIYNGIALVS